MKHERGREKGYQKLNPTIPNAIRGKYMQYSRKIHVPVNFPIEL